MSGHQQGFTFEPGQGRRPAAPHWRPTAADTYRAVPHSCWNVCELCSPILHEQKHKNAKFRVFRECTNPLIDAPRCFESSMICEYVMREELPPPPPIPKRGWEDY